MKKGFLLLSSLVMTTTPIVAVISCGDKTPTIGIDKELNKIEDVTLNKYGDEASAIINDKNVDDILSEDDLTSLGINKSTWDIGSDYDLSIKIVSKNNDIEHFTFELEVTISKNGKEKNKKIKVKTKVDEAPNFTLDTHTKVGDDALGRFAIIFNNHLGKLELPFGVNFNKKDIENLITVDDERDGEISLKDIDFKWNSEPNARPTDNTTYTLTIDISDSHKHKSTYVLEVLIHKEGEVVNQKLNLNFSNTINSLSSAKIWYDDLYGKALPEKPTDVILNLPDMDPINATLTSQQITSIKNATELDLNIEEMNLTDFATNMQDATGSTHQYYFAEQDALMLGVDKGDHSDAAVPTTEQKAWLIKNIIGELPIGIEMSWWNPNTLNNNITVTFKSGDQEEKVTFHLGKKDSVAEAEEANATGGSKFIQAINAVSEPFKIIGNQIKLMATYIWEDAEARKAIIEQFARIILDRILDVIGDYIPIYSQVINTPLVGAKISDYVNEKIIDVTFDLVKTLLN